MIELENVSYKYKNGENVLENINLKVENGEVVAVIGKNGSGKSTLARIISGISIPKTGTVILSGIDTKDKKKFIEIRKTCGIVFQNPENQIVFNNVHDDMSFALDNLKLDNKEERIKKALEEVGMLEYLQSDAYDLSLGQKQRITIASVLSINPKIIVLDEPTAMLDSEGKESIKAIVKKLKEKGFTIIYITNVIDEIFIADRTIMLEKGKIIKEFETKEIIENIEFFKEKGIAIPKAISYTKKLREKGIDINLFELI